MMLRNKGEAIRSVQQALRDDKTTIGQDPESFQLVELGEYCQDTGVIKPYDSFKIIGTASELQQQQLSPQSWGLSFIGDL